MPDPRLDALAAIAASKEIIPTRINFVDIAGIVRGASKGEGLGNQFLANIREVDAIIHVVRCFEDGDITHVEGKVDPAADIETIETELMLADLESLEKRVVALEKRAKGADKEAKETLSLVNAALPCCARASPPGWWSASPRRKSSSLRLACSPPSPCFMSAMSRRPLPTRATPSLQRSPRSRRRRRARRRRFRQDRERGRHPLA